VTWGRCIIAPFDGCRDAEEPENSAINYLSVLRILCDPQNPQPISSAAPHRAL